MKFNQIFSFLLFIVLLISCKHDDKKLFKKLTANETGINFNNKLFFSDSVSVLEFEYMFNGGGVALIDINNDSLQDILFTGNMVSSRLFLNKGNLHFEDITKSAGVETNGWCNGVAVVDINQDGYKDFYIAKAGHYKTPPEQMRNLFFINNGNNTFTESAAKMGLDESGYDIHAAFFDYDKDGDLDMYLLRNAIVKSNRNTSRVKEISGKGASTDKLFRNNGDMTFTDVSGEAGITIEGFGLGVNICDINNDNWPDVYVSNDFLSNDLLWTNNHDGTFTNKAGEFLRHQTYNGMGNDVADFNNDGLPDIVVVDMLPPGNKRWKLTMKGNSYDEFQESIAFGYEPQYVRNTLQLNNGDGSFSEIGMLAGIHATEWSWAPLFADFDNDGWKDVFISNGFRQDINNLDFVNYGFNVYGKKENLSSSPETIRKERLKELRNLPGIDVHNYVFRNEKDLKFADQSDAWGMTDKDYSNGTAYGDLDNDGDLDLVINILDGPSMVYENRSNKLNPANSFLRIGFKGPAGNRDGLGAKVWMWQKGKMQFNYFSPYRGYLSTVEHEIQFGIDDAVIDSVKVLWPDGKSETFKSIKPRQWITFDYKNASDTSLTFINQNTQLLTRLQSAGIAFKHKEDFFVDFKLQPLLPHMHSRLGPGIAVGDINIDGIEDFFVGNGAGSSGSFYIQQAKGNFIQKPIEEISKTDDMGVLLFDADNDGDNDLYIGSGGASNARKDNPIYQHRLFINDGSGNFKLSVDALPVIVTPASGVKAADFDRDGDLDLFVCGRNSLGEYPLSPKSFLLQNDSKNEKCSFSNVTGTIANVLSDAGMISDALWTDFDNDGWIDLIAVGEFTPIRFFKNNKGTFEDVSDATGLNATKGWWNSIAGGDFDRDGDIDYVIGNLGLNGPYKATASEPVCIYAADYDKNGRLDPIMCHFIDGKEYMVHSRNDIIRQITPMRGRFLTFDKYASATFPQAMTKDEIAKAYVLKAETFESSYIQNLGNGKFAIRPLPLEAQFSPLFGMTTTDIDGDGFLDVIGVGNSYSTEVQTGRYDAQGSIILKNDGRGNFIPDRSILNISGDNKSVVLFNQANGSSAIIIGSNSDSLRLFGINNKSKKITLNRNDAYALITADDGRVYRYEFYYGDSYLSQGTRSFTVPHDTRMINIYDFQGHKRAVNF
jgi:hypothetical protein